MTEPFPPGIRRRRWPCRLWQIPTGEVRWREATHRQLRFLAGAAAEHPIESSFGLLAVAKALSPHRELVCAAAEGLPRELEVYLRTKGGEDLSVLVKTAENEAQLARCAPFTASYPVPEQGTVYYLCENGACQAPTRTLTGFLWGTDPAEIHEHRCDSCPGCNNLGSRGRRAHTAQAAFFSLFADFSPKSWSACGFLCKLRCIKIR